MARTLTVTAHVDVSGPLLHSDPGRVLAEWERNTSQRLARESIGILRNWPMNKSGRATGAFQSHLRQVRLSGSTVKIPGPMIKGVTWAPWLEGVSTRNGSTSFKGYHLFRETAKTMQDRAQGIGEQELEKVMAALGGE